MHLRSIISAVVTGAAFAATVSTSGIAAQDAPGSLPQHIPLNPMAASRSGLYVQPYLDPAARWMTQMSVDYGSAVEWEEAGNGARYVLDAELMRVQLSFRRDLSDSRWFSITGDINGAFNGFADQAFDWYHSSLGIPYRGREQRPRNEFGFMLDLPNGIRFVRQRPDYYLGDTRLSYGLRHSPRHQTTITATLPTSTAPEGYSRRTVAAGAVHTFRTAVGPRVSFEGTVGAGFTPSRGEMASVQSEFFNSASAGIRLRLFGQQTIYGYAFTHSPYYRNTTLPELDNREVTGDFGWMGRTRSGREWRVGLTEDFGPTDQGIDLILRVGITW